MASKYMCYCILSLLFSLACGSTLFGYYNEGSKSELVSIDIQKGISTVVCDLSSLPPLSGASSSSNYAADDSDGTLFFYTIDKSGNISLIALDPLTCKYNTTIITGLSTGQNSVRDIKYDGASDTLYMVFPNPNCMHGSLNTVNVRTGAVISHLTNVIDPEGLSQTSGLSEKTGTYYYVSIPIGASDAITYQLNKVQLSTGNTTAVNLANNTIDVGDTWGANYTMNVAVTSAGESVIGAVSPSSTTVNECSPSGFFSINTTTGNVVCEYGPIKHEVYPLAELDISMQYFYQLFNDENGDFYIYTYDIATKTVIYTPQCEICSKVQVLAALP